MLFKAKIKHIERIPYCIVFLLLVGIEVLIALLVHDRFIRPYVGDVLIVGVIYSFVRIFVPNRLKLLALYVFLFTPALGFPTKKTVKVHIRMFPVGNTMATGKTD